MTPDTSLIDGKVAKLFVLDYGLFHVNAGRTIGICGFLIQTDTGRNILVDTGFPEKYVADAHAASIEDGLDTFGRVLKLGPENLPAGQLATLGLTPSDVHLLVMTHSHIDHIGGIDRFLHAPIVIARAELALERPLYHEDVRPMTWPKARYVEIEDEIKVCDGLRLLMTPGHAPGQMSALVNLPSGRVVVLASDAISRPAEFDEGFSGACDPVRAAASGLGLTKLVGETGAFLIYGHCPRQWPGLRKAPLCYD